MNIYEITSDEKKLQKLIENQVQENLNLDYKDSRAIDPNKGSEIAKDVSAFANSDGGMIIYGIQEDKHFPVNIDSGVDHTKFSKERLEQIILSNITPRIDGLKIYAIPLDAKHSVFVVDIPKSYRGPHQEKKTKSYYKRHNFLSDPMEDYEIQDIRNRRQIASSLITVYIVVNSDSRIRLVIENIGNETVNNIDVNFSDGFVWRRALKPRIFETGITSLAPKQQLLFTYGSYIGLDENTDRSYTRFDVTVTYRHPVTNGEISDTFNIDLLDFWQTSENVSEIEGQTRTLDESLKKIARYLEIISHSMAKMPSLSGLEFRVQNV